MNQRTSNTIRTAETSIKRLMTADKVTLRLNAVLTYRVTDPLKGAPIPRSLQDGASMGTIDDGRSFGELNFGAAELGDRRRTKRLVKLADQLCRHPGGSLPDKLKSPADLYFNKHHNPGDPIQTQFDLSPDIEEHFLPGDYPDSPPEE